VFAITAGIAEELVRRGIDPGKISLLPNGVEAEAFSPMEKDAALRSRYGLEPSDFVLVYCGSLTLYEGLDDLIEAVVLLCEGGIAARLLIVGDGPARLELESLAERRRLADAVSFVGSVDPADVRPYWSLADAVALPRKPLKVCEIVSPLKPFEAMAMGKPVVLSDLPVLAEIVKDGETGRLCEPASPQHLASILEELARDPALRARLGAAGREWVLAHRTWGANVSGVEATFAALAGGSVASDDAAREHGALAAVR
jgi:glycosyltransferase involved in cell wall biosynthesis